MDATSWDDRYAAQELVWGSGPNQFLPDLVDGLAPGRALDVACGEGRNAVWLAEQGWQVVGVDFSEVAIDKARRLAEVRLDDAAAARLVLEAADLRTWRPSGTFDLIIEFYFQVPAELRRHVHRTLAPHLAPGGRYIVVGHHLDNLTEGVGGPPDPAVLFTETDLATDFEELLSPARVERLLRPTEAGTAVDALYVGSAA